MKSLLFCAGWRKMFTIKDHNYHARNSYYECSYEQSKSIIIYRLKQSDHCNNHYNVCHSTSAWEISAFSSPHKNTLHISFFRYLCKLTLPLPVHTKWGQMEKFSKSSKSLGGGGVFLFYQTETRLHTNCVKFLLYLIDGKFVWDLLITSQRPQICHANLYFLKAKVVL